MRSAGRNFVYRDRSRQKMAFCLDAVLNSRFMLPCLILCVVLGSAYMVLYDEPRKVDRAFFAGQRTVLNTPKMKIRVAETLAGKPAVRGGKTVIEREIFASDGALFHVANHTIWEEARTFCRRSRENGRLCTERELCPWIMSEKVFSAGQGTGEHATQWIPLHHSQEPLQNQEENGKGHVYPPDHGDKNEAAPSREKTRFSHQTAANIWLQRDNCALTKWASTLEHNGAIIACCDSSKENVNFGHEVVEKNVGNEERLRQERIKEHISYNTTYHKEGRLFDSKGQPMIYDKDGVRRQRHRHAHHP